MTTNSITTGLQIILPGRHLGLRMLCLACCCPFLLYQFDEMWRFRHLRHLPFAAGGFALLLWSAIATDPVPNGLSRSWDRLLLFLAVVGAGIASAYSRPDWGLIAAILVVASTVVRLRSAGLIDFWISLLLFLGLLCPIPEQLELKLSYTLQNISACWASSLLDGLSINHVRVGNIIWANGEEHFGRQAFNGLPFLYLFVSVSAWWGIFRRRQPRHTLFLICSSVFWAVAINALWMTLAIYLQRFGIDILSPGTGRLVRVGVFGFGLLMLICIDLAFVCSPNATRWLDMGATPNPPEAETVVNKEPDRFEYVMLFCFVLVFLSQVPAVLKWPAARSVALKSALPQFSETDLPAKLDDWSRDRFFTTLRADTDMRGLRNASWELEQDGQRVRVLVDFPFSSPHDDVFPHRADGVDVSAIGNADDLVRMYKLSLMDGSQGFMTSQYVPVNGDANLQLHGVDGRTELASTQAALRNPGVQVRLLHTSVGDSSLQPEALMQLHGLVIPFISSCVGGQD